MLKVIITFILNFFLLTVLFGQSLTIYTIPPPKPLNWKSPHHLLTSLGKNYMAKKPRQYPRREIGHVFVEIIDHDDSLYTSITSVDDECFEDVVVKKKGMAVLFKKYAGGHENPEEIKREINKRSEDGRIAFIRFLINDSAVVHLHHIIDSFKLLGYDKIYGGMNAPRKGKGAGCSSYAVCFLEILDLLKSEFREHWLVKIDVPENLIADSNDTKKVRLRQVFFSFKWGDHEKKAKTYVNYEPSKIFEWINHLHDDKALAMKKGFRPVRKNRAKGLEMDSQSICKLQYPLFETEN